jgi:hypothetical protein
LSKIIPLQLPQQQLPADVQAIVQLVPPHPPRFLHATDQLTSRVQLEMKIGQCNCASEHGKTDIVLLRDRGPVTLTCHVFCPSDIIAAINANDVVAAIELKACPSSMGGERAKCSADIEKLFSLVDAHRVIAGYFVFLDKSIAMPQIAEVLPSQPAMHREWTDFFPDRITNTRPPLEVPYVTIWDINPNLPLQPRVRFYR